MILSLIAACIWASIIVDYLKLISEHSSNDSVKIESPQDNETFFSIAFRMQVYSRLCSINFILIFIKVLKYLASWFDRVMIIFKTLAWAQSDIFYFLIMYMIIFFAFVVMCHIYYGADLEYFGTIF